MKENELEELLESIKKENERRGDAAPISEDETNEFLNCQLQKLSGEVLDEEDSLCEYFGLDGYYAIREAEKGRL